VSAAGTPLPESALRHAVRSAWTALRGTPCARTGALLGDAPLPAMPFTPDRARAAAVSPMPVLAHLDAALALAAAGEAAAAASAIAGVAHGLPWGRSGAYTEARVGEGFLASYGYGLMTGPEGPLRAQAPRAGLILLAPHFGYPDHRHPPREAYLVLTPGAQWRLDRGAWFDVSPGTVIHHASQQWHAVRAGATPFLGFVAWLDAARPEQIEI
jgi:hypothetical protein